MVRKSLIIFGTFELETVLVVFQTLTEALSDYINPREMLLSTLYIILDSRPKIVPKQRKSSRQMIKCALSSNQRESC